MFKSIQRQLDAEIAQQKLNGALLEYDRQVI